MRTACYARFSSDLQRDVSIDDQVRDCREYAERRGWTWCEDQIYTDVAISAATLDGRAGVRALMAAAAAPARPFDVLLVDDSSRVARDLPDALRTLQLLKFYGVRVIYISQGIDSENEQAETLVAVHGLVDSLYLREMAAKIKRGLRGQIQRGFATGQRTYGYRTVRVPDPGRPDLTTGFAVEIDPVEAAVVQRVFADYAAGVPVRRILEHLNADGTPAVGSSWKIGAVQRLLTNEKYSGKLIWGRQRLVRRPGTRQKTAVNNPRAQWEIVERPDLRIVSDALWAQAQERKREYAALTAASRRGGLMRGRSALVHSSTLFGGFLTCGVCGRTVGVVNDHVVAGRRYRYYGCFQANHTGPTFCTNNVTARVEVAESALLAGLQETLLDADTLRYITSRVVAALNAAIDARPAQRAALRSERERVKGRLAALVDAVETGRATTAVYQALQAREAELEALDEQLRALDDPLEQRVAVMPTWIRQQLQDLVSVLAEEPDRVRARLRTLGLRFTVRPVRDAGPRAFLRAEASGDFLALAIQAATDLPSTARSLQDPDGTRTVTIDLPATQRYLRKQA